MAKYTCDFKHKIHCNIYIYIYIKKPKNRCVRVNIKQKNTFSIAKPGGQNLVENIKFVC